ncbi:uncharacterized protein LOC118437050 [Folsomia candida]|uniref:uncharacterized protein LOC118437050 n=1 Tax=Folsomia candida TaxID=158441 RepID=UPI00160532BC|nr:uncharacterized protein LOC118437050 [Folsomia candida]
MARIKNESMTISKPCMGLFLQGGVKALSVVEAGVDVLLMIVGTIAIFLVILRTEFQNEMEAGSWKFYARIISWGYSYFYAFTCITLSHRLFSYASQRNTRGVYFCITIPGIMHIGCILNFGLYTVFVKWSQPAVMTAFLGYIFYKFYFFWVTISYFRDINRSGLLNPALRQLSDEEIEEFYYGSNPSEGSDKVSFIWEH